LFFARARKADHGTVPQYPNDRGYATTREQAMADFKAAWEQCKKTAPS
jgi:hypothetical protein